MRHRFENHLRFALAVSAVACASFCISTATVCAGDKPEKASVPEPSGSLNSSNLVHINPNASARNVEDDLLKPLRNVKGSSSLDALFDLEPPLPVPPVQQQLPGRRSNPNSDRRKNWAFSDLTDPFDQKATDDLLGGRKTDQFGREESPLSLIEMYYQSGFQKNANVNASAATGFNARNLFRDSNNPANNKVKGGTQDFDPLTSALTGSDNFFRKMLTGQAASTAEKPVADNAAFGSSGTFGSTPEEREQQRRLASFRHELDPSYPLPKSDNPFSFVAAAPATPARAVADPLASFQHTSLAPVTAPLDPNLKAFHSHVYDDPTATALGQPQKSPFQVDRPTPPPPTAQSVLSKIDPFDANAPKRKF